MLCALIASILACVLTAIASVFVGGVWSFMGTVAAALLLTFLWWMHRRAWSVVSEFLAANGDTLSATDRTLLRSFPGVFAVHAIARAGKWNDALRNEPQGALMWAVLLVLADAVPRLFTDSEAVEYVPAAVALALAIWSNYWLTFPYVDSARELGLLRGSVVARMGYDPFPSAPSAWAQRREWLIEELRTFATEQSDEEREPAEQSFRDFSGTGPTKPTQ